MTFNPYHQGIIDISDFDSQGRYSLDSSSVHPEYTPRSTDIITVTPIGNIRSWIEYSTVDGVWYINVSGLDSNLNLNGKVHYKLRAKSY